MLWHFFYTPLFKNLPFSGRPHSRDNVAAAAALAAAAAALTVHNAALARASGYL
jgi:hypothetical protein